MFQNILIIPIDLSWKRMRNRFRLFYLFMHYTYIYIYIDIFFEIVWKLDNVCPTIKRHTSQGKPCVTYIHIYIYMHSKGDSIPGLEGACDHIRPPIRKGNRRKGRFKGHKTFVSLDDARAATRNGILRSPANAGFRIEFEIRGLDFMVAGCQTRLKYRVRKTYTARNGEREKGREGEGRKSFALKSKPSSKRIVIGLLVYQPVYRRARCGGLKRFDFIFDSLRDPQDWDTRGIDRSLLSLRDSSIPRNQWV